MNETTLERVKEVLLSSLGDDLQKAEALGVFGSLARGIDFSANSDIDIFVVLQHKDPHGATDKWWWKRIKRALEPFQRDVTVLVYTVGGLKAVCNWYVLRLAAEGVLLYDQGAIAHLFERIVDAARQANLVQDSIDSLTVWTVKPGHASGPLDVSLA